MKDKVAATDKLHASSSVESRARRAVFNTAAGGRANQLGENELVDAFASGEVKLDEIDAEELPEALKPMAPAEQEVYLSALVDEREDLQRQIRDLSADRDGYLAKKVEEAGGMKDSLDNKIHEAVKEQAVKAGLEYDDEITY